MFPKGLGSLGDLTGMIKQATEVRARLERLKESLADETVEASVGGGMVKVVMTGKFGVVALKIEPEVVNKDEKEMLETLVRAAINEGVRKVQELVKNKMREAAGGLDLPWLSDILSQA